MDYKETREKAVELGIEVKGNPKKDELEQMIADKQEELVIAAKAEGYEKPKEEFVTKAKAVVTEAQSKVNARKNALKMVKCIITPLDERMRDMPSEMYSVGNRSVGFIKKVVRFNEETIEPTIILKHLKEKRMLIQQTKVVNGRQVVSKKSAPAFAIQELAFTEEELENFKNKNK